MALYLNPKIKTGVLMTGVLMTGDLCFGHFSDIVLFD